MKGQTHFRHQRLSAYALIILLPALMLTGPFAIAIQGLAFIAGLYHSLLGLTMVIEDYVHCGRVALILATKFITVALMAVVVWHVVITTL